MHLKRSSQHMVKSGAQHMEVWKKRCIYISFPVHFGLFFFLKVLIDLAEVCWGDARGQGL